MTSISGTPHNPSSSASNDPPPRPSRKRKRPAVKTIDPARGCTLRRIGDIVELTSTRPIKRARTVFVPGVVGLSPPCLRVSQGPGRVVGWTSPIPVPPNLDETTAAVPPSIFRLADVTSDSRVTAHWGVNASVGLSYAAHATAAEGNVVTFAVRPNVTVDNRTNTAFDDLSVQVLSQPLSPSRAARAVPKTFGPASAASGSMTLPPSSLSHSVNHAVQTVPSSCTSTP